MPRRAGSGPMGAGSMTGRGAGACTGSTAVKYEAGLEMGLGLGFAGKRGFGRGLRYRFGRGYGMDQTISRSQKELRQEQSPLLQDRLEAIEDR